MRFIDRNHELCLIMLKAIRSRPGLTLTELAEATEESPARLHPLTRDMEAVRWLTKDKVGKSCYHNLTEGGRTAIHYIEFLAESDSFRTIYEGL